ncbi:hypothetical protein [Nonomuraea rubra]|uniref:NTF2 domain-containing protein n=1 Tax=Nonomuraea rubra TaxID=46180 RepID=A0A7X0U1B7_9ACTN|nr:hypothetical protein [Nonomuraea rubra]MBB6551264.1 hypothetical protein [Nonomuraea rubra]
MALLLAVCAVAVADAPAPPDLAWRRAWTLPAAVPRKALTAYYTADSVLIAKGRENRGREAIATHLANLPSLTLEPQVCSEQQTPYGPQLIVSVGHLRHEGDQETIPFTETFLVTLSDEDTVIHNQAFFFVTG